MRGNADNVVVIGDMNGHVGRIRTGVENVIGAFGIGPKNREGERIIDFCVMNNLSIMNTFYRHKETHKWSWYRWDEAQENYRDKSPIDFVLTNNKRIFKDVKAIPSVSLDSDHRLIVAKMCVERRRLVTRIKRKRYKIENLKIEEKRNEFTTKVQEILDINNYEETQEIQEEWNLFSSKVKEVADEVVGVNYIGKTRKKRTPWWTEEVETAVKTKMKSFQKWMKTRTVEDREEYTRSRNMCEEIKRSQTEAWKKIGEDLQQDLEGTRKLLYSIAKNYRKGLHEGIGAVKDETGENLSTNSNDMKMRWQHYFQDLLNVDDEEQDIMEEENMQFVDNNRDEITHMEVEHAIKMMKNGKAPGEDEIPVEFLKEMKEVGVDWMTRMANVAWGKGEVPDDWGKAVVCPIYKKGDKAMCSNYRGISLLSHTGKIYERILERRG